MLLIVNGNKFIAKTVSIQALSLIVTEETSFRLARVETPTHGEKDYECAQETLANLVGTQTVGITMIGRDDCGRPIVEVYTCLEDGVFNVNDEMVRSGWAEDDPYPQFDPYNKISDPFFRRDFRFFFSCGIFLS